MFSEDNICQSIWDKSEVLWRTCGKTHWELGEHIGNLMGNMGASSKLQFLCQDRVPPLWVHLYRWEREIFGLRIWDKVRCYWEHPWEQFENLRSIMGSSLVTWGKSLGTYIWTGWEHDRNTRIKKMSSSHSQKKLFKNQTYFSKLLQEPEPTVLFKKWEPPNIDSPGPETLLHFKGDSYTSHD